MKFSIILGMVFLNAVISNAQTNSSSSSQTTPQVASPRSVNQISIENNDRFRQLEDMGKPRIRETQNRNILNENIQSIYRKPSKEETKILEPDSRLLTQYQIFLRQSNTGIIKLNADVQCSSNEEFIVASENCLSYRFPGGGTAFSFRVRSYRIPRLADITLEKNVLKTDSILQHGILVNLGDVPLEEITIQSKGLNYLTDFKPAARKEDLAKIDKVISGGVKADGFIYRLGFYASRNTTFALRSIAYKASVMRSVNGIVYDEFQFDKRKDILIVFRIIDIDSAGNVTILWKELQQRDSPNLKLDNTVK